MISNYIILDCAIYYKTILYNGERVVESEYKKWNGSDPTRPDPARPGISATRLPSSKHADFGPPISALSRFARAPVAGTPGSFEPPLYLCKFGFCWLLLDFFGIAFGVHWISLDVHWVVIGFGAKRALLRVYEKSKRSGPTWTGPAWPDPTPPAISATCFTPSPPTGFFVAPFWRVLPWPATFSMFEFSGVYLDAHWILLDIIGCMLDFCWTILYTFLMLWFLWCFGVVCCFSMFTYINISWFLNFRLLWFSNHSFLDVFGVFHFESAGFSE